MNASNTTIFFSNTSGASYSSWSNVTQQITVKDEEEQNLEKLGFQNNSIWGNANDIQTIYQENTSSLAQKPLKVGAQPKKNDQWDRVVPKYLKGIERNKFEVYPTHNNTYYEAGDSAQLEKTITEGKVLNKVKGIPLSWDQLQLVCNVANEESSKYNKAIKDRDLHLLPVQEIFKNYDKIELVKTLFKKRLPTLYIPCEAKWEQNENYKIGTLEVTLLKSGEPIHVFFRTVYTRKFLEKEYGETTGRELLKMHRKLQKHNATLISLENGNSGEVILLGKNV